MSFSPHTIQVFRARQGRGRLGTRLPWWGGVRSEVLREGDLFSHHCRSCWAGQPQSPSTDRQGRQSSTLLRTEPGAVCAGNPCPAPIPPPHRGSSKPTPQLLYARASHLCPRALVNAVATLKFLTREYFILTFPFYEWSLMDHGMCCEQRRCTQHRSRGDQAARGDKVDTKSSPGEWRWGPHQDAMLA